MFLLFAACTADPTSHNDTAGTSPGGGDTTCLGQSADVALDAAGPGGFTALDAIGPLSGPFDATFVYDDASETTIHLTAAAISARVLNAGGVGTYYAYPTLTCTLPERFEVSVEVTFATDDGAFDEVFVADVGLDELPTTLSVVGTIAADALAGTYTSAELDSLSAPVLLRDDGTSSGELVEIRYYEGAGGTNDGGAVAECGIGAWGGPLSTDCP